MRFITKLINSKKIFTIVDIWTYKIRCNIIEIEKNNVTILGYGEKKQEPSDFEWSEIINIDNVSKNLKIAIKKAESAAKEQTKEIIINNAGGRVFYIKENTEFERHQGNPINKPELKEILTKLLFSLKTMDRPLQSWVYWTKDMRLILWNIRKVEVDEKPVSNLIFQDGKEVSISMNQFFMESGKHEMLKRLASNIDKKLGLIIPYENSIKDLVNELSDTKDYMVINIGNAKTTIVIVRDGEILATNYFNIGIGELIDDISKNYKVTNIKAIKTIDTDGNYNKEKLDFYKVWEQALKITLESTLWNSVCPHEVFVFWWGYNKFIEENLEDISFHNTRIKMRKNISLLKIDEKKKDFLHGKYQLDVKSNLSLISMIISTMKYFKGSENEMVHMLQKLLKKQS